jgi:hypothetical protein
LVEKLKRIRKKIYVTGDGICPWCGKLVIANEPATHHIHFIVTTRRGSRVQIRLGSNLGKNLSKPRLL